MAGSAAAAERLVLRVALPAALTLACAARVNLLSLVYGLFALVSPFLPRLSAGSQPLSWWTQRYLQCVLATGLSCAMAQIAFHVSLLSNPPYGRDFTNCGVHEEFARQFGFQRLDEATTLQLIRLICPEVLVCVVAVYAYNKCILRRGESLTDIFSAPNCLPAYLKGQVDHQDSQATDGAPAEGEASEGEQWRAWLSRKKLQRTLAALSDVGFTVLLGAAGVVHPCAAAAPYFALYLLLSTSWALNYALTDGQWQRLRKYAAGYSAAHLFVLYVYQLPVVQGVFSPLSFAARLLGCTAIVRTDCAAPTALVFVPPHEWPRVLNPFILLLFYGLTAIQLRVHAENYETEVVTEMSQRVSRNRTIRAVMLSTHHLRYPALRHRAWSLASSASQKQSIASLPSYTYDENTLDADKGRRRTLMAISPEPVEMPAPRPTVPSRRRAVFFDPSFSLHHGPVAIVVNFLKQQSYVVSLLMMMAWSITYHSWLTFVMLLMACAVWMVPDTRKFCLRLSPFLVVYATMLLCVQFIYGLDLTQDELPDERPVILRQIGLEKPRGVPPCVPLFTKAVFTLMFLISLRQHLQERSLRSLERKHSLFAAVTQPSIHLGIVEMGASKDVVRRESSAASRQSATTGRRATVARAPSFAMRAIKVRQLGAWARALVAKYWVLINLCLLNTISLRQPVVVYRVLYMAYFNCFVNCFQISFPLWRRLLYPFWMVMVCYCMTVLTLVYTYQFHGFPELWRNWTGLSQDVIESFGMERYSSGQLVLKLLTPISFLIFTLIQVNFFHADLMKRTEKWQAAIYPDAFSRTGSFVRRSRRTLRKTLTFSHSRTKSLQADATPRVRRRRRSSLDSAVSEASERKPKKPRRPPLKKKKEQAEGFIAWAERAYERVAKYQGRVANVIWQFLEIHMGKLIAFSIMQNAISEVSAINIPYMVFISISMPVERLTSLLVHIAGVWTSGIIVLKLIYQMKFIKDSYFESVPGINGTVYSPRYPFHDNSTVNVARWLGFYKTDDIYGYLWGYLCLIMLMAFRSVVIMRQRLHRKTHNERDPPRAVLFPHVGRSRADDGLPSCLMYLANYAFYKFGLEMCFLSTVITVGVRSDFVSIFYSLSLIVLLSMRRKRVARVWPYYVAFLASLFPAQYCLCVGMPPSVCSGYPWSRIDSNMVEWLFLPDFLVPPNPIKLIADFFQLLFACCQLYVFRVETSADAADYAGGSNVELAYIRRRGVTTAPPPNPVPDFISYSKSYLDVFKVVIFIYAYWLTLAMVFIAGTTRVTMFAFGYVASCFGFLWVGNELFLKPLKFVIKLWNALIFYNVIIIWAKTSLQVVGCVYMTQMYENYCWVLQLFGIACLKTGMDPSKMVDAAIFGQCNVPTTEAGIKYDGICFFFLLLQRRIFCSYYFKHVIAEFRAQQVFASRGAELIAQIRMKEVTEEQAKQEEIVAKVKKKTDKIREAQDKKLGRRRPTLRKGVSRDETSMSLTASPLPSLYQNLDEQPSVTIPVEPFSDGLDADNVNLRDSMGDLAQADEPSPQPPGTHIASPSAVRKFGVFRSIEQMRLCSEVVPVVAMADVAPEKVVSPSVAACHFGPPDVRPSPDTQPNIPFLTTPPSVAPRRRRHAEPKQQLQRPQSFGAGRLGGGLLPAPRHLPQYRRRISLDGQCVAAESDEGSGRHSDASASSSVGLKESPRGPGCTDDDRRRGLGPLQLLNAAFKKGAIKQAVLESRQMEMDQFELEKQMEEVTGRADPRAIRKHLMRQKSRKALPDFEEETFEEQHISTEVVGADYECKYELSPQPSPRSDSRVVKRDGSSGAHHHHQRHDDFARMEADEPIGAQRKHTRDLSAMGLLWTAIAEVDVEEAAADVEPSKLRAMLAVAQESVRNGALFLKMFLTGVLESVITWLLKFSRDYRYVAHVLAAEKRAQKELFDSSDHASLQNAASFVARQPAGKTATVARLSFDADDSMIKIHEYLQQHGAMPVVERPPQLAEDDADAKSFDQRKNVCLRLLIAVYYVLISRSELFCYLVMVLNHMSSASLLTMALPIMAFLWGTLSVPRPSKRFWISVITYTEATVIVKYLFQFGFVPWNRRLPNDDPFWAPRILGIERRPKYAAWDLALLMVLFFHRSILKTLGLWTEEDASSSNNGAHEMDTLIALPADGQPSRTPERLSIQHVSGTTAAVARVRRQQADGDTDERSSDKPSEVRANELRERREMIIKRRKAQFKRGVVSHARQTMDFFGALLKPVDRYPVDVYAPMFLCDFICFIIVIFGYSDFGVRLPASGGATARRVQTDQGAGGVAAYFEENKVPGAFLAMLIVQFVLIVIDRALFLRKFLFGKLVYQITLVGFIHFWMFIVLPGVTERLFIANTHAKLWYFTKCIYFCISAWQIRSGYPTGVLGNFLTKKYTMINWLLMRAFMLIPFLFEIRTLMDWIWTDTSMSLGDWLKLSDIYTNLYLLKCERKFAQDYPSPRGVKKRPLLKYGLGGVLLFIIIMIIWFPLVLFSLANTVGIRNLPVECSVTLSISGYEPMFHANAQQTSLRTLTETEYDKLHFDYRNSRSALGYMADYGKDDVVKASLDGNSSSVWAISPPSKRALIDHLTGDDDVAISFRWTFTRAADGSLSAGTVGDERRLVLPPADVVRLQLADLLTKRRSAPVQLADVYPPFVKIPGSGTKASEVYALLADRPAGETYVDVQLWLESGAGGAQWWRLSMTDPSFDPRFDRSAAPQQLERLQLVGFSDKVFPATFSLIAGSGILGLYLSLVLVVHRMIRVAVTGGMFRIMFDELPNVDRVLQLCLDIFLVREAGELALEEDLYAKLIFLYRSPATLIRWSRIKDTEYK